MMDPMLLLVHLQKIQEELVLVLVTYIIVVTFE